MPRKRHHQWVWISLLSSTIIVATGLFLLIPPNISHSRYPGCRYLDEALGYLEAVSDKTGGLAVSIRRRGKVRIYVGRGNADLIPVTSGTLDADPAWDPAGTRIAYVSLRDHGRLELRIHDLREGSDIRLLEQALISQPLWSHDGTTVFFLRSRPDIMGQSTICAIDLRTKTLATLAKTAYNRPQSWGLMNSDQLVYTYDGWVWTKTVGASSKRIPVSFGHPCMVIPSPDDRMLFVCDSRSSMDKLGILVDLDTLKSRQVYRGYIREVFWSPSGRSLAIAGERETMLFVAGNSTADIGGWQFVSAIKGVAVCWRSDSALLLIRPDKHTPYHLEEVDIGSGASTRLAPSQSTDERVL